jgi:hypothetical protein
MNFKTIPAEEYFAHTLSTFFHELKDAELINSL